LTAPDPGAAPAPARARAIFGVGGGIASTVYGTVTAMATIAAFGAEREPWTLAGLVASTAAVFWIAHIYAHGLSESIALGRPLRPQVLAPIARRELGIVRAAVPPVAALLLGAIGILGAATSAWLALGLGLATLAVEGARYARLEAVGLFGTVAAIAANIALGMLVVALKVGLAH
jgi:hypothetical protein